MRHQNKTAIAGLLVLVVIQLIMLGSLFAKIPPHPPEATPLFGIAPFVGSAIGIALAAIVMGPLQSNLGRLLSFLAIVMALVSFGPQKYFDAQFDLIWPGVITAQMAIAAVGFLVLRARGTQGAGLSA